MASQLQDVYERSGDQSKNIFPSQLHDTYLCVLCIYLGFSLGFSQGFSCVIGVLMRAQEGTREQDWICERYLGILWIESWRTLL